MKSSYKKGSNRICVSKTQKRRKGRKMTELPMDEWIVSNDFTTNQTEQDVDFWSAEKMQIRTQTLQYKKPTNERFQKASWLDVLIHLVFVKLKHSLYLHVFLGLFVIHKRKWVKCFSPFEFVSFWKLYLFEQIKAKKNIWLFFLTFIDENTGNIIFCLLVCLFGE